MTEADIQLNTEGTGPLVRTIEVDTYPEGDRQTVNQQVVVLADKVGRLIDNETGWREQMLLALKRQNELLEIIAVAVSPH